MNVFRLLSRADDDNSSNTDNSVTGVLAQAYAASMNKTAQGVGVQIGAMAALTIATFVAFSFFRPREKKVYAPKLKYSGAAQIDPFDPDYEPPPPEISNGFLAWISPVVNVKEKQLVENLGLDAATFLRFLRMVRNLFAMMSVYGIALLIIYVVYNQKNKPTNNGARSFWSQITLQNVRGNWIWPAVAFSYLITFTMMFTLWRNWQAVIHLRQSWFRSPSYQRKVYARTLMVTQVPKQFRSDEGLLILMGQLKIDGIKLSGDIECATIGRRLGDFPDMVKQHNDAVRDLERVLVKYLKHGKMANKRPTITKGAFLGMGGKKHDAIDYYANQIKFLKDRVDARRSAIDSLIRKDRKARKGNRPSRVEGESYGFVTLKTVAEAHRIARAHTGSQKELSGASVALAPVPQDIIWENMAKDPAELTSKRTFGWLVLALFCFVNVFPILLVSALSNLSAFSVLLTPIGAWKDASPNSFAFVTVFIPPIMSILVGYFFPIIIRRICKYQGAKTRSFLERSVTARYYAFLIISTLIIFSLAGTIYNALGQIVISIGQRQSFGNIMNNLRLQLTGDKVQKAYIDNSTYWLSWLPLRGFLVFYELIQLFKLALVSMRRVMFSYTPRDIRDLTKPAKFEYAIVSVNILFIAAVGLVYAPLSPAVAIGAAIVFWFSSIVYKYQLLYVYISRAESGGRMWNVYCNRLLFGCLLMQLLMMLTTYLIRQQWYDLIAGGVPVVILIIFKVVMSMTTETRFRYYKASEREVEQQRLAAMQEKSIKSVDLERRFLHPALSHRKMFQVMVHKSQEQLARQVLSSYPWFADKGHGVEIKAVREENLEYDPDRDGPHAPRDDFDNRSIASTTMLSNSVDLLRDNQSIKDTQSARSYTTPFDSSGDLADYSSVTGRSSEDLLRNARGMGNRPPSRQDANAPLIHNPAATGYGGVPYPPSSYTPTPYGYGDRPSLVRSGTDESGSYMAGPAVEAGGYFNNAQAHQYGGYGADSAQTPPARSRSGSAAGLLGPSAGAMGPDSNPGPDNRYGGNGGYASYGGYGEEQLQGYGEQQLHYGGGPGRHGY